MDVQSLIKHLKSLDDHKSFMPTIVIIGTFKNGLGIEIESVVKEMGHISLIPERNSLFNK